MKLATLHFLLNLQDEDLKLPEEDQHSPSSHNGFTLIRPPFHQRFPSWLSPLKRFFHPFPFLYFFWHIFLRCLHILCIKGKKKQEASLHKKLTQKNRKENNFCRIIFKDKRRDFLLRLPFPPKHTPNKKTRSMWLSREREKKAFFFPLRVKKVRLRYQDSSNLLKETQMFGYDGKINFPLSHFLHNFHVEWEFVWLAWRNKGDSDALLFVHIDASK